MFGAAAASTVGDARDGLRRSPSPPRALRQSLPPRPARQVPRLRARPRLVDRQPARADGDLLPRLRRPLEEQGAAAALPALPADRPRALDLLRDLAADGRDLDARLVRADQEGALPAAARRLLRDLDPARDVRRDARDRDRALADHGAGGARHRLAGAAARRPLRRVRLRPRARDGLAERALPRRRAHPRGGAAALVLP